ncbi:MAG TPA: DUF190 domain-containing protein [Jatrophihabitans sp.]|nr:DUF190 domain-containing protein [Jatrophihabitans sp.]
MTGLVPGRRLTIILDEDDTVGHLPAYTAIVRRAHQAGLAGASVFRGIEGFGASGTLHASRILSLAGRLPVLIVLVDSPERIEAFLPAVAELAARGVVTVEDVEILPRRPEGGR